MVVIENEIGHLLPAWVFKKRGKESYKDLA